MQSVLSLYSRFEHPDWDQSPERMSLAVAWTRLGSWRRRGGWEEGHESHDPHSEELTQLRCCIGIILWGGEEERPVMKRAFEVSRSREHVFDTLCTIVLPCHHR